MLTNQRLPELEQELKRIRRKHFAVQTASNKLKLQNSDAEIREELSKVLEQGGMGSEASHQLALWNPYDQNTCTPFFDSEFMFGIEDGFDIVIGNPPYIDSETMIATSPAFRELLTSEYSTAVGNWDLFVVFVERGTKLLNTSGCLIFIIPNKVISAKYTVGLREYLNDLYLIEIRDYSHINVFQEAAVYPVTLFVGMKETKQPVNVIVMNDLVKVKEITSVSRSLFCSNIHWSKFFHESDVVALLIKLSKFDSLSKHFTKVLGAATVSEAYEIKEHLKDSRKSKGRRFVNTGTIDPYCCLWGVKPTQYIKSRYQYPVISDTDLNLVNSTRLCQAKTKKLIVAGMSKCIEAIYDDGGFLAGKSTIIILDEKRNLKLLLGILNSRLISFFLNTYYHSLKMSGGYLNISKDVLFSLPLPNNFSSVPILELVDKILDCKKKDLDSDIENNLKQIDEILYDCYGLTEEEITVVEKIYRRPELKTKNNVGGS